MKKVLSEIQDGTFKKQFADENATDAANLKEMRAAEAKKLLKLLEKDSEKLVDYKKMIK